MRLNLCLAGVIDNATLEVMMRPRCGMPDILVDGDWYIPGMERRDNSEGGTRKKRYTLLGK